MKTLVVITHPNIDSAKVNRAWLQEIKKHPDSITAHELYRKYPDGKITDVAGEQALVDAHDNLIFQFPMYWFSSPPLLKQWLDDVFAHGWAYGSKGHKLQGKKFGIAVSMGSGMDYYAKEYGIEGLLVPFRATAHFVGMDMQRTFMFFGGFSPSEESLQESASQYIEYIKNIGKD